MTLPNLNVVEAIFESYLNIRIPHWKTDIHDIATSTNEKLAVVIECLKQLQNLDDSSVRSWLTLNFDIYKKVKNESEKYETAKSRFLGLAKYVIDDPLLLYHLQAVQSYINSFLYTHEEISEELEVIEKSLSKELSATKKPTEAKDNTSENSQHLTKEFLSYVKDFATACTYYKKRSNDCTTSIIIPEYFSPEHHIKHFDDITLKRDPVAKLLNEKSFNDFVANVEEGARKLTYSNALLPSTKNESVTAAPTSTTPVTLTAPEKILQVPKKEEKATEFTSNSTAQIKQSMKIPAPIPTPAITLASMTGNTAQKTSPTNNSAPKTTPSNSSSTYSQPRNEYQPRTRHRKNIYQETEDDTVEIPRRKHVNLRNRNTNNYNY